MQKQRKNYFERFFKMCLLHTHLHWGLIRVNDAVNGSTPGMWKNGLQCLSHIQKEEIMFSLLDKYLMMDTEQFMKLLPVKYLISRLVSSAIYSFLLTVCVPKQWTWQIFATTLCWSYRWGGLLQEGWLTSPTRSTSSFRWSRLSSRANGGEGLSRSEPRIRFYLQSHVGSVD